MIDDDQQLDGPPTEVLAPRAAVSLSFTMRATASVLHRLAGNHLWAAAHFARTVRAIETANAGRKFEDGTFFAEIQAGFHACVMLCGAALDANVNELMETELREGRVAFADPKAFRRWVHASNPLRRYSELAVLALGADRTEGAELDQVRKFALLRNGLVHFYPEWHGSVDRQPEPGKHPDIVASLPRLAPSPFIVGSPEFPLKYATHSYARWAVNTVYDFLVHYEKLLRGDAGKWLGHERAVREC